MSNLAEASIATFADVARGYCAWCEGDSLKPDPETQAASWLARLYAATAQAMRSDGRRCAR
jgi:hypothetical protein